MFCKQMIIFGAILFACASACNDSATVEGDCSNDSECASGLQCVAAKCVEKTISPNNTTQTDMGNNTNNDAGQQVAKPHNYRTFSVGSGKISGGGYKAKVRLTSTPAGKQTTDVVKQKVGSP